VKGPDVVEREYRAFDSRTVRPFAARFLPGPVSRADEIGDGNLNQVFRVEAAAESVIVKQALPYLRAAGESWPLTRHRARIESDAVLVHTRLAPGLLPEILHYDEYFSAMVLEDLRGHVSWREALIAGRHVAGVAETVGRYSARVLLGTSELTTNGRQRRELRRRFGYSELCQVTEDLVFTAPFHDADSNRYDPEADELARSLRTDRALGRAVADLKVVFRTRDEALLHGDLHTGSVMIADGDARVIDLEFAYYGPIGFDIGALLAHLAIARVAHGVQPGDSFGAVVDRYAADYWAAFREESLRLWQPSELGYEQWLGSVLTLAAGFAGVEMMRRIVGLAHARDIDSLDLPLRLAAARRVISGGRSLVLGGPVTDFDDLWHRATGEDAQG
jgi:5-methylthioribose kinase